MSPVSDKIMESVNKQVKHALWSLCETYGCGDVAGWAHVPKSMMEKYRQQNSEKELPLKNAVILGRYINDHYKDNTLLDLIKGAGIKLWATDDGESDGRLDDNMKSMIEIMSELSAAFSARDYEKYRELIKRMKNEVNNFEEEGVI